MRRRTTAAAPAAKPSTESKSKRPSAKERAEAALSPSVKAVVDASLDTEKPRRELPQTPPPSHDYGDTRASKLQMTGFESIIDNVFTFDPDATYAEVVACLEFGQKASRTDYGSLVDALDAAEENARKALQLVANAKVALISFKADIAVIQSELHRQAVKDLMIAYEDKDNTDQTRKPTKDDVEAYKAAEYHDEYTDAEMRLEKGKRTVEYLEGLASLVAQRARDLRQMCASARGA